MSVTRITFALLCGAVLSVSACARQPEPVTITPIYDKYGEASCPVGTVLVRDNDTSAEFCAPIES